MNHKLILTKLGHPDHVGGKFARSKDEVAEIIVRTFELGKSEIGYGTMMGQYLPDVSKKGFLNVWYVDWLYDSAKSGVNGSLANYDDFDYNPWNEGCRVSVNDDLARYAFDIVGDALQYNGAKNEQI